MAFIAAGAAIVSAGVGLYKAIDGGIRAKKARKAAEKAQREIDKQKAMFASLDTSNPYANMENTMEDLTVNQQSAEFMKQQQMQSQANILDQLRSSAGGSGIAALAQTLANQGNLAAQKASADIAKQEQANQMAERQEASKLQSLEREGELISRQAEAGKIQSLLGLAADEKSNQLAAQSGAREDMFEGVGDIAQAGFDYAELKAKEKESNVDLAKLFMGDK
jgi:hypothetical protein|tara:strand:- start:424 stop:1089 length:666 start_codon:yes stop_codon:yes gene_type:complete